MSQTKAVAVSSQIYIEKKRSVKFLSVVFIIISYFKRYEVLFSYVLIIVV